MKTKSSSTSYSVSTRAHHEFAKKFADLSGCDVVELEALMNLIRKTGAVLNVSEDTMEVMLSDMPVLSFDISCQMPRISCSPLMLKIYAFNAHLPLKEIHEITNELYAVYDGHGKDPIYLDIDTTLDQKEGMLFLLRRLQYNA